MEAMTEILFAISNGLLVPVILGLLFLLARGLVIVFGFYRQYMLCKSTMRLTRPLIEDFSRQRLSEVAREVSSSGGGIFGRSLERIVAHSYDDSYCQREAADYQVAADKVRAYARPYGHPHSHGACFGRARRRRHFVNGP